MEGFQPSNYWPKEDSGVHALPRKRGELFHDKYFVLEHFALWKKAI